MRYSYLSASAALLVSASLMAQVPGTTPQAPATPGTAAPSVIHAPQAVVRVLPNAYATKMGNSNNIFGVAWRNQRYQQLWNGAQVGTPMVIRGHSLRFRTGGVHTGPTQTLEHRLCLTTRTPATMTTTFASNITSAQTIVFTAKSYKYPNMTSNTNPGAFAIHFKYDKPFVWTAAKGQNLLLETRNTSTASGSYYVDAANGDTNVSRMWSNTSATAATGTLGKNFGIIVRLDDGTIPTLGSYVKFGKGCLGTGGTAGIILPASRRTAMGNSNNYYGVGKNNQRYAQVWSAGDVGTPRVFNGHSVRTQRTDRGGAQVLEFKMSNTTRTPATLTTTFASNITSTQTTVYTKKSFNYPNMVANSNVNNFQINFKWDKPWVWTAAKGQNVLMETVNTSAANLLYFVDAHSGDTNVTRMWGTGPTAATGTIGRNYGIVIRLNYAGTASNTPALANVGVPQMGKSFAITLSGAKASTAAALWWGSSNTKWGAIPLPLSLAGLGAPGCNLLVSPDILSIHVVNASGASTANVNVPNIASLKGVKFHNQFLVIDAKANSLGMAFTNGGTGTIGG